MQVTLTTGVGNTINLREIPMYNRILCVIHACRLFPEINRAKLWSGEVELVEQDGKLKGYTYIQNKAKTKEIADTVIGNTLIAN